MSEARVLHDRDSYCLAVKEARLCMAGARFYMAEARVVRGVPSSLGRMVTREYSTYRAVTISRLKTPRHLVLNDNLKTFTKYSERSVENL